MSRVNPLHSSTYPAHGTPHSIAVAAQNTMGSIDLDPASNHAANKIIGAERYYTKDDNGLVLPWEGSIFLNPPGGVWKATQKMSVEEQEVLRAHHKIAKQQPWWVQTQSISATWWDRLFWEYKVGNIEQAIFLAFNSEMIGNRPDMLAFPICLTTRQATDPSVNKLGRILFLNKDGQPGESPTHTNALVYLPPKLDTNSWVSKFENNFSKFGLVGQLKTTGEIAA